MSWESDGIEKKKKKRRTDYLKFGPEQLEDEISTS